MGLKDLLTALQDPQIVWNFQKTFGVEKVKEVKNSDSGPWVALDAQHIPKPRLPDNVKVSTAPELTEASFEGSISVQRWVHNK